MTQRYYQHGNTGTYVLELEGSLTRLDDASVESLEKTIGEIARIENIKSLIIYQPNDNFKIDSLGMGEITGLCSLLKKRNPAVKTVFAGLKGSFAKIFERGKFDRALERYETLEEALKSE